ncbi:MAG: amidohydrolase family protein [Candidatus Microthrix sp.]|nr:amidohydrolase family protein [Candidatus Microthrix sp.]MBK6439688.1 amidohydrolase family protein [Candidatus Microthrix sp.]
MNQDSGAIEEMLTDPTTILGLADTGAHATQIMDASQPTYLLSHWVRDRGVLSLQEAIRRLTSDTADFIGYVDRGVIREGAYADLNVLDLDSAGSELPEIVHDFPAAPHVCSKGARHRSHDRQRFAVHGGGPPHRRAGRPPAALHRRLNPLATPARRSRGRSGRQQRVRRPYPHDLRLRNTAICAREIF